MCVVLCVLCVCVHVCVIDRCVCCVNSVCLTNGCDS